MKNSNLSIGRLILIPFVISLLVTLLRLTGELQHWSETWFYRSTSGLVPNKTNWVFGITWLAVPFGIYFAYKLAKSERVSTSAGKVIGLAVAGLIVTYGGLAVLGHFEIEFVKSLIIVWSLSAASAMIQLFGWRRLFKALLAYGLASRAVVALVMFLAMHGNWGTHYDYFDFPPEMKANLLSEYFLLAFFPQLIFWVGFTVVLGSLSGGITLAIMLWRRQQALAPETVRS